MKNLLSLSALLITLTLTAQSTTANWYFNDTSGNGIQSNNNTASGDFSTASTGTTASGDFSTAMGAGTTASGQYSTAMGFNTRASKVGSTAMGFNAVADGDFSTAMGGYTIASQYYSTAMGFTTRAKGIASTAMGDNTTASGRKSTAMGYHTEASDRSSLVIGEYNLLGSTVTNSAWGFSTENTAFVIGNGTLGNRSDALTVLFDGTTTIAGDLSINSDARLKANIISLGSTLAKLLQIDGKSYTMKKDENKKQKIGVLAQDIEKVFPELVSESNGVKSVNYQGLVPVLINALKEQDSKMNEQEAKLNKQQAEIDKLKAIVSKLITQ
ncbi:MAG: Autotransporter adhesin EhaG [Bacteroidota bacterium]|nr:MAG: Autotransporter adhesin EhaG [Bacteroidota bacterium]